MIDLIKVKTRIGELFNENINNETVNEAYDFDYDGKYACISFQKSPDSQRIRIEVRTQGYLYIFLYPNNKEKFVMAELDCVGSRQIEMDDSNL